MSAKPDLEQIPTGDHLGQLVDMRSMKDHSLHGNEILLVDTQDGVQLESERKAGSANKKDELSSLHQLLLAKKLTPFCFSAPHLPTTKPTPGLWTGAAQFFSRFTTSRGGWLAQTGQLFWRERLFIMDDCAIRVPLKEKLESGSKSGFQGDTLEYPSGFYVRSLLALFFSRKCGHACPFLAALKKTVEAVFEDIV